jgi:hypothetical protein
MTLHDLTEQLHLQFPPSVQKDLKTAVRTLAQALNYSDPKSCPLEACLKPLPQLYSAVETHLISQGKSPYTIRNTKNNISRLFRLAEMQGLFSLLPVKLSRRFKYDNVPHRTNKTHIQNDGSHLRRSDWPPEVEVEFAMFVKWATDPLVPGRDARLKKRPTTILIYQSTFEAYFGYLHHTLYIHPIQFDHLFDFSLLERFVYHQINDKFHRVTRAVTNLIGFIHTIASQYRLDPPLREFLKALRKRLPPQHPFYNKSDAWVPLHELEQVGLALWPLKPPAALNTGGATYALRAAISLMLRLWVHIPYRQRNMREMKLDQNLYRTPEGQWRIRFANEELKIAKKRGQSNVFDLPFPPTLINTLESYLTIWRPILAHKENASEVFLNRLGRAFTKGSLHQNIQGNIYSFTGRHWHPHMIRTIWATEWIKSHGDFYTAAIMLNDRLETVIQNYAHLMESDVAEKAYEWVQSRVNSH